MLPTTEGPEPELAEAFHQYAGILQRQNAAYMLRSQSNHARFKSCQYIAGEPSTDDACKCGAPTDGGGVYCADHHALCTHRPEPGKGAVLPLAA